MTKDASEILDDVQTTHERVQDYLRPAAEFFHSHEGDMFNRSEARNNIVEELDISGHLAREVINQLVSDKVDPVVQVTTNGTKYVGVVEFYEFDGAYGYLEYDDVIGERKRVVCQQCVNEADFDKEVSHATEKSQSPDSSTFKESVEYDELLKQVHSHYSDAHSVNPEEIETGATLASGTTIGGNNAFHAGNATLPWDDDDANRVYTLPNSSDGISVGPANMDVLIGNGSPYSTVDDGSDIKEYQGTDVSGTIANISGEGVLLGGVCNNKSGGSGIGNTVAEVTVDGGTTINIKSRLELSDDSIGHIPPIKFDSSLTVSLTGSQDTSAVFWVKE